MGGSFFVISGTCIAGLVFRCVMYQRKKSTQRQRLAAQETETLLERAAGMWCGIFNIVHKKTTSIIHAVLLYADDTERCDPIPRGNEIMPSSGDNTHEFNGA